MITATPTKFELYDDGDTELLATVEMVDEVASTIEIKTCVSAGSWPELARVIQGALDQMHPKKELT